MKFKSSLLIGAFTFFTVSVQAHPVSYQGAWSLMSYNQPQDTEYLFTYSLTSRMAIATRYMGFREAGEIQAQYFIPQLNFLLKRWNQPGSQANIYVSGGYGAEFRRAEETKGVGLFDLEADWESRRLYTSAKSTWLLNESGENENSLRFRAGFAPYLGEYDDLNTWFIVQLDERPGCTFEATPMFRFYYRNVLWEVGASLNGNWLFNFMIHM